MLVVDGWEQAYNGEFSGAAGEPGTRPLVVSYASSPPAEVYFADPPPDDGADRGRVEPTCFRQVEFAGVLAGRRRIRRGAREFVDFMLSERFQRRHAAPMFVFPAVAGTPLPPVFTEYATVPATSAHSDPGTRSGRTATPGSTQWTTHVLR